MSQSLKETLLKAYHQPENEELTNAVHRIFLQARLILPIEKNQTPAKALFIREGNKCFMPVFSATTYFEQWAGDSHWEMSSMQLSGQSFIKGLSENVVVCLDIGQAHYKQFMPDEVSYLTAVVAKLEKIALGAAKG